MNNNQNYNEVNYEELIDWDQLCQTKSLSEDFMRQHQQYLNWDAISWFQKLSSPFIIDFAEQLNWDYVSCYQQLNIELIERFKDRVNWKYITQYQIESFNFINQFGQYLDWNLLYSDHYLSESFIRAYKYNLDWPQISRYIKEKEANHQRIYYSKNFIIEFKPFFNKFYVYNFYANIINKAWVQYYYKPGNKGYWNSFNSLKISFNF